MASTKVFQSIGHQQRPFVTGPKHAVHKQVHEGKNLLDSPTKVLVFVDGAVISDRSQSRWTRRGVTGISER